MGEVRFPPLQPGTLAHQARADQRKAMRDKRARERAARQADGEFTLTRAHRRALHRAKAKGGAVVAPAFHRLDRNEITRTVAELLERAGYLTIHTTSRVVLERGRRSPLITRTALTTRAGRAALDAPTPAVFEDDDGLLHGHFLANGSGTTTDPKQAVHGEPEIFDADGLATRWKEQAAIRKAAAETRTTTAARLRKKARRAA